MASEAKTHDISLTGHHLKDVKALSEVLNQALSSAFPRSGQGRYSDVYVLLLSWEDDDLGVATEIAELDYVFRKIYRYRTDHWRIPSMQSHIMLVRRILQALEEARSSDTLLIFYYGGHGYMNEHRDCVWLCNQQSETAATVQWSSIQTTIGQADLDVLILLDCCAAASSAGGSSKGHTEVIGACGFESSAPGVGEHSFTKSLIEELRYYGDQPYPISTAFLYGKILDRAKNSWNPRYERDATYERRRTPVHIHLADRSKQRCIVLTPFPSPSLSTGLALSPTSSNIQSSTPSTIPSGDIEMSDPSSSSQSSLSELWFETQLSLPKVLISVALKEGQALRPEDWIDWLKSVPAAAECVRTEGVYKSDSTLLLLSLPVAIWDMLPKDPAISFIAFIRSYNILGSQGSLIKHRGKKTSKALSMTTSDPLNKLVQGTWGQSHKFPLRKRLTRYGSFKRTGSPLSPWSTSVGSRNLEGEDRKVEGYRLKEGEIRKIEGQNREVEEDPFVLQDPFKMMIHLPNNQESEVEEEPFVLKNSFRMIIHLPNGLKSRRGCLLDTAAPWNVIADKVVEALHLEKQEYEGAIQKWLGRLYKPKWEVTFDWHVAGSHKTYTTTFVVLHAKLSEDWHVVLGRGSIVELGFYQSNTEVW
ncbi:MAG: hypothetical protein Q9225_001855 [Loekoesia sp. 1 TL-2023]